MAEKRAPNTSLHLLRALLARPWLGLVCAPLALATLPGCQKSETPGDPPAQADAPAREGGLLAVGSPAPDFNAVAHSGQKVQLSELRGKVVVLYFYPKDGTPGCTTEAQQFAEYHQDLDGAGAIVLGVSSDDNESHRKFADEHSLPFLLLPDTERSIAEAYGVGAFLGMTSRVTYVIDRKGRVARVYPSVKPSEHAEEILRDIKTL